MAQTKPVAKFRAGAISSAIWTNDIRVGNVTKTVLKCTVERRYKDASGEWKSTGSYGRNEIPLVMHVLSQAFAYIINDDNNRNDDSSADEETVL